jgi:DNA-binding CsgD family transcriptional regulator
MSLTTEFVSTTLAALRSVVTMGELHDHLCAITNEIGFRYFVLTHHAHPKQWSEMKIALHNCPAEWVEFYAEKKLYKNDPVLLACSRTITGFNWDDLATFGELTERQLKVLSLFRDAGIGSGITIPAHIPGEPSGSCSFATRADQPFPTDNLLAAQMLGAFAFQAARRISGLIRNNESAPRPLTPRQRDCLLWAMRGKTDWEIAQILEISAETVTQHLNMARERYGAAKRMQLAIRAIYLGDIGFDEVIF